MPKLKFSKANLASKHLLVTKEQHKEIFRIAALERQTITGIVKNMLEVYNNYLKEADNDKGNGHSPRG